MILADVDWNYDDFGLNWKGLALCPRSGEFCKRRERALLNESLFHPHSAPAAMLGAFDKGRVMLEGTCLVLRLARLR